MNWTRKIDLQRWLALVLLQVICWVPAAMAQALSTAIESGFAYLQGNPPATLHGQSATLLPDGRWLLLGGEDAVHGATAQVWLIASPTKDSVPLPNGMPLPRSGHTATVLPDGSVLIVGGVTRDGTVSATSDTFDPATLAFQAGSQYALLPRAFHTATLLTDGRLLIVGGYGPTGALVEDVEIVDFFTGTVERFNGKLETARFGHLSALLPAAPAVIWGGFDGNNQPLQNGELFDPLAARFTALGTALPPLPQTIDSFATPVVAASLPPPGAVDVPVEQVVSVRFSKPLRVETLSAATVTLFGPGGVVPARVVPAGAGLLLFVTPEAPLTPDTSYTLFISGATDTNGVATPFTATRFATRWLAASRPAANSDATGTAPPLLPVAGLAPTTNPAAAATTEGSKVDQDVWTPGPEQHNGNWRIGAATPKRATSPLQAAEGVTAVSGEVNRLNGQPLAGVTLRIGKRETRTNSAGQFLLVDVPTGGQTLEVDSSSVRDGDAAYGLYFAHLDIPAGRTTVLPYTIWLAKLDPRGTVTIPSPTIAETVVTSPAIPGLELRLPAGTVIRDRHGRIVTEINITAIPTDRPPFPLPDFNVPTYFTIQPGGAWLQGMTVDAAKGARLIYPNYAHEVPGAGAAFWNYDARERGWYLYGMGKVSADGRQVIPDANVVIYEFSGAMINNDPPPPPGPPPDPCDSCPCAPPDPPPPGGGGGGGDWSKEDDGGDTGCDGGGDPVSLSTGQFTHTERDLWLPDVVPIDLKRSYRALDLNKRTFGIGMTDPHNIFLWSAQQYQEVDLILPSGSRVHYARTSPGSGYNDAIFSTVVGGQWSGSTIAWNATRSGWDLVFRDGRKWYFPEYTPLTEMVDANGNKTTIVRQYGNSGPITRIDSPNGRWITFISNTNGVVTSATDNGGRTFAYTYDASNQLATVTDPAGGIRRYTWDANHRLMSVKDPNGNIIVQNVYDANGRVTQQTEADGSTFTYAYTLDGNGKVTQTDLTDRRGNVRRVAFDANGFIVRDTFPLGKPEEQVTTFTVNANGWRTSKTDALGRTTTYSYDANGNRTGVTLLSGTPNATTTTFTYTPTRNRVATLTDPLGHVTSFTYDPAGNLTQVTDANGNSRSRTYDAQGRVLTQTDGLGHTTTFSYYGADLITLTDPLGRAANLLPDSLGRSRAAQDALGNWWVINYDNLNRITDATDPLGNRVAYTYDANSKLLTFTDPRGGVTTYTYNSMSKVASRKNPLNNTDTVAYDLAGKLTRITDRKGQVQGFTYDNRGRRAQIGFGATVANPTAYQSTISYTYDAGNRVTQIVDSASGTITRSYDTLDRLTQEQTPLGTVSYAYDAVGRRTSMTVAGQPVTTYGYDNGNRLTQIQRGSETIGFVYDPANRRTQTTLSNGVAIAYGYDNANQLTAITYTKGATTLGNLTYAYDATGQRTGVGGTLAQVNLPQALASAVYNANNQLVSWGGQAYSYDLNGNLVSDGARTYTWDARDQLSSISGSATAAFQYDGFGRRQSKTVNGTNTQFVYDGLNFVQELASGTPKANLITGLNLDEVYSRTQNSLTASFLTDAIGSAIALTDSAGAVATSYAYEPYGAVTKTGAASENTQQFTGRENDGTGLMYYRARYYTPSCGRFISEDPARTSGIRSRYAYVNLRPADIVDPLGLWGIHIGFGDGVWWGATVGCSNGTGFASFQVGVGAGAGFSWGEDTGPPQGPPSSGSPNGGGRGGDGPPSATFGGFFGGDFGIGPIYGGYDRHLGWDFGRGGDWYDQSGPDGGLRDGGGFGLGLSIGIEIGVYGSAYGCSR